MKKYIIIVLVLCASAMTSRAGLKEGLDAFNRHDYATALPEFLISAQQGDAESQYFLAAMYTEGWGVTKDYAEALRWYLRAAEQGHVRAQQMAGLIYGGGYGVEKDYIRCFVWLSLANTRLPPGEPREDVVTHMMNFLMTPEQRTQAEELIRTWQLKIETPPSR